MKASFLRSRQVCGADGCNKDQDLKTCSRCKVMKYCSKECQSRDLGHHKECCKKIKKFDQKIQNVASAKGCCFFITRFDRALQVVKIGVELKDFGLLSHAYDELAEARAWFKLDTHFKDGVLHMVHFLDLLLGREDYCHNYIKYYLTLGQSLPLVSVERLWVAKKSKKQSNHENLLDIPMVKSEWQAQGEEGGHLHIPVMFHMCLICLKILMIYRFEEGTKAFAEFTDVMTNAPESSVQLKLANCDLVMEKIKQYTTGLSDKGYRIQETHLKSFLAAAHRCFPETFLMLIQPGPFFHPDAEEHFGIEWHYMSSLLWLFFAICPTAKDWIGRYMDDDFFRRVWPQVMSGENRLKKT